MFGAHAWDGVARTYIAPYRVYMPSIGRWLSRDPVSHPGINPYNYV